jgi:hypothetical protein
MTDVMGIPLSAGTAKRLMASAERVVSPTVPVADVFNRAAARQMTNAGCASLSDVFQLTGEQLAAIRLGAKERAWLGLLASRFGVDLSATPRKAESELASARAEVAHLRRVLQQIGQMLHCSGAPLPINCDADAVIEYAAQAYPHWRKRIAMAKKTEAR